MDEKRRNSLVQQARQISFGAISPSAAEYYSDEGPTSSRSMNIIKPALAGGSLYGIGKLSKHDIDPHGIFVKKVQPVINKVFDSLKHPIDFDIFDTDNYYYLSHFSSYQKDSGKWNVNQHWASIFGRKPLSGGRNRFQLKWGDVGLEAIRRVEESFAKLPRMFGLSSALAKHMGQEGPYHIPAELSIELFNYHIRAFPDAELSIFDYMEGTTFYKGKLYKGKTTSGKPIIDNLELLLNETIPISSSLRNEGMKGTFGQSYQRAAGMNTPLNTFRSRFTMPFIPVPKQTLGLTRQLPRMLTERYMRLLDSPFEFLGNFILGAEDAAKSGKLKYGLNFGQKAYAKIGLLNRLGTGGDYTGSAWKLWERHILGGRAGNKYKLGAPVITAALIGGYSAVDNLLRNTKLLDNTVFSEGVTGAVAETIKTIDLSYSKASEITGFTAIREHQEEKAGKRATRISALAGLAGAGWLTGRVSAGLYGTFTNKGQEWTKGLLSDEPVSLVDDFSSLAKKNIISLLERTKNIEQIDNRSMRFLDKAEPIILSGLEKFDKILKKVPLLRRAFSYETRGGKWGAIGAAAMAVPASLLLPGALGSRARTEDLKAEYAGTKEVPIRKGRFWEMGTSPYEGGRIITHVPNWYQRLITGAREKGIYGEEYANKPVRRMLKSMADPYWLEKQEYYTRPYPLTGASTDTMFALGHTIGRLFKPPKMMHSDELYGGEDGDSERIVQQAQWEQIADKRLGGKAKSKSISPYSVEALAGEGLYRYATEKGGLLGYALSELKNKLTGSPDWFDSKPILEDFNRATGSNRAYWDQELGGGLLTTEPLRRILPNRRFQVENTNPIPNAFYDSSWLPGPGDKGPDVWHGDPYSKLPMGEIRLPGPGYASLHPELKGLTAEEYPDIYKMKILADIAPYADKTREYLGKIRLAKSKENLSEREIGIYDQTLEHLNEKKKRKEFRNESSGILGAYSDLLFGVGRALPSEFLTPLSPVHKLGGSDTAINEYEESLYASDYAAWGTPVKSFIMPTISSIGDRLGFEFVPGQKKKAREIEEYFDILKYVKAKNLSHIFKEIGDTSTAAAYNKQSKETIFGAGQLSRVREVFKGLPADERDYFAEFLSEKDESKRDKIQAISPNNMRRLYSTIWEQADLQKEMKATDDEEELKGLQEEYHEELASEGFPVNDNLYGEFIEQKRKGGTRSYSDFMRSQILQNYFSEDGYDLPDESWLGWSPLVQLDDVKMKVVQNEGMDIHDVGLWETRERELIRKPYLNEISEPLYDLKDDTRNREDTRQQLISMLYAHGFGQVEVFVESHNKAQDEVILDIDEDPRQRSMQEFNRILSHGRP